MVHVTQKEEGESKKRTKGVGIHTFRVWTWESTDPKLEVGEHPAKSVSPALEDVWGALHAPYSDAAQTVEACEGAFCGSAVIDPGERREVGAEGKCMEGVLSENRIVGHKKTIWMACSIFGHMLLPIPPYHTKTAPPGPHLALFHANISQRTNHMHLNLVLQQPVLCFSSTCTSIIT
jgi:hypothetical protein